MKLMTFKTRQDGEEKVGVVTSDEQGVVAVEELGLPYATMHQLIDEAGPRQMALLGQAAEQAGEKAIPLGQVIRLAPIPRPAQDVICLGINYMAHAEESARYKKEAFGGERSKAIYFSKRVNRAVGDGEPIPSHAPLVDSLDYEAELAVILKKDAVNVAAADAYDYIFGYTVLNDVSARNLQTAHKQWYFGKSLDGFCPMGPWIVTADEIAAPPVLGIQSRVNGELRQNSSTALLIFDIAHVVSELSQGMTLKAGAIIAMGTPAGVGMGFEPPRFLQPGDVVECSIEKIGTLRNRVE